MSHPHSKNDSNPHDEPSPHLSTSASVEVQQQADTRDISMPDGKEEFISIVVLTATLLQEEGVKTMVVIGSQ